MNDQDSVFVARQPIFDRHRTIWGYELFFRKCGADSCALLSDPSAATLSVIADGFAIGTRGLARHKTVCLNICHRDVLDHSALALPPKNVLLEIPMAEAPGIALPDLQELQQKGYRIALDGYQGQDGLDGLLHLVDLVKINFANHEPKQILCMRARLKAFDCGLAASKIESWEAFEGAKALGFQYFQGEFFSAPETLPGRSIPSGRTTRLRLIQALANPDMNLAEIVGIFSSDPPLSYRLLSYINSPAMGLGSEVTSLKHAIALLGLKPLRHWAMAALISDYDRSDKGSELSWISLHRALFLKLLAENGLAGDWAPETLFLLGLFSRIDAILGLPMGQVLENLPFEPRLKDALTQQDPAAPNWLSLLKCLESDSQEQTRDILARFKIPANMAAVLYMTATKLATAATERTGTTQ
jgi:EAL and modified HD-GYP domain-containing signal transduction protein